MAVISKGITLGWAEKGTTEFTELENLQEIPELGGDAEKIEITVLSDAAHMYTDGILNYGDAIAFKFLYEKEQFVLLNGKKGTELSWRVKLPDDTAYTFDGTPAVKLDGVGVNAALTYTLNIAPTSEMVVA